MFVLGDDDLSKQTASSVAGSSSSMTHYFIISTDLWCFKASVFQISASLSSQTSVSAVGSRAEARAH